MPPKPRRCRPPLLALLLAAPVASQDATADAAAHWRSRREGIARLMQAGDWIAARRNLDALLAQHPEAPHAVAERESVLADLRRIHFHLQTRAPDLDDLVAGEVLQWKARTGQLHVRHGPGAVADLAPQRTSDSAQIARLHPAMVVGDAVVTVELPAGPQGAGPWAGLQVLVGVRGDAAIHVLPGAAGVPCRIAQRTGGNGRELARAPSPWIGSRPRRIQVRVAGGRVEVIHQGRVVVGAAFSAGPHQVGYLIPKGAAPTLTLQGRIDRAWPDGLVAAAERGRWAAFQQAWRPAEHAPAWLLAGGDGSGAAGAGGAGAGDAAGRAPAAADPPLPWAAAGCLELAERALDEGRVPDAQAAIGRALPLAPGHPLLRVAQARVALAAGDPDAARDLLQRVLAGAPAHAAAAGTLALHWLDRGDTDRCLAVLRAARAAGCRDPELLRVQGILDRAVRGPTWRRTFTHATDRVVVQSDADRGVCVDVARLVAQAQRACDRAWGRETGASRPPLRVFVFRDRQAMLAYTADLAAPVHPFATGLYQTRLRQLLVWRGGVAGPFRRTVHHEVAHAEVQRRYGTVPVWWNEGQAEWLALQGAADGPDRTRQAHLQALQEHGLMPMGTFIALPQRDLYRSPVGYAQAWWLAEVLRGDWPELDRGMRGRFAAGSDHGLGPAQLKRLDGLLAAALERASAALPAPR